LDFRDDRSHPNFEDIVMDSYRQDSGYTASNLTQAEFDKLSADETVTYRSWRRGVMAFYCAVLLLGGFAIAVSIPVSHQQVAQVMPAVNVP
jgi:hypothetical protein